MNNYQSQGNYQGQQQGYGYGGMQYNGGVYAPGAIGGQQYSPLPQAKMTQGLTVEDIKELRRKGGGFSLDIPPIEFKRARCTHKENGAFSLVNNNDGTHTCTICGKTLALEAFEFEVAKGITDNFLNLFELTKLYYLNMPESYIENITQMIPVIQQMPELYRIALADFQKYENAGNGLSQRGGMYGANLLNAIVSPGFAGGYQQPINQPNYGQPQMQYGQPQQQYYPQQQGGYPVQGQVPYSNGDPALAYQQQYAQPGQYPAQGTSNGFGYQGSQQAPIVNQGQQQPNQGVQGGNGSSFSKENVTKGDPTSTKIYNN